MFGINMHLLRDFNTSAVSQSAPENSLIWKVTKHMLGITWFYNTHLKCYDKNKVIFHFYWQLLTIQKMKIALVIILQNNYVKDGSDLTHNCDVAGWKWGRTG